MLATDESRYTRMGIPAYPRSSAPIRGSRSSFFGSVRGVYDASKVMTAAMDYTPYGQPRAWRGDVPSPTYTGHHWDGETGMYFAPYRYYMPDAGRWLTRDPLGMVDGPNVYGYSILSPIISRDPLGLYQVQCDGDTSTANRIACALKDLSGNYVWDSQCGCCKELKPRCHQKCDGKYKRAIAKCGWNPWCRAKAYTRLRFCYLRCTLLGN